MNARPGHALPPPPGATVDEDSAEFAIWLIETAGVAKTAEQALAKTTGRPRSISVKAILVALVLLAMDDRALFLTSVTDLLYAHLPAATRRRLGIADADISNHKRFLARYRCVRYTFHALCSAMDPSGLPKNRRLTNDELATATRPVSDVEAAAAREKLETFINTLLESTLSVLDEDEYTAWAGDTGLDATPVPLFSQGPSTRTGRCASDPDGAWYVRDGDHRDTEDHTGRKRTRIHWALEATIATTAAPPGHASDVPKLATGLALDRPGIDPGGTGTRVLNSIRRRGHPAGKLGADRAYTNARPESFHLPVTALGYTLVADYRADQLGVQANTAGAILLEGTFCCPATPQPLINATTDLRDHRIDDELYTSRIAARADYALRPKEGPDIDGYIRMSCPALGEHARLSCPLRDHDTLTDGRTPVLNPPEPAPKICTQTTITIAPDIGARHRQHLQFGTDEWARHYATMRNTIEGLNGYLKDPAHQALAAPGRRRVRGLTAQSILCAILLTAANLRTIRTHRSRAKTAKTQRPRRRRTSLHDHLPQD